MRFDTGSHRHWCGIDLHAKTMYVCILDAQGQTLVHKNLPATPEAFLETVEAASPARQAHQPTRRTGRAWPRTSRTLRSARASPSIWPCSSVATG